MPRAHATLAQSVEQLPRKEQVRSSILLGGSKEALEFREITITSGTTSRNSALLDVRAVG